MIRFHNTPKDPAVVLRLIRDLIGEPHAHDGQTFLFNIEMPHRYKSVNGKSMVEIYRAGGYPVDLEYNNEGRTVKLKDQTVHSHSAGKWHVHI